MESLAKLDLVNLDQCLSLDDNSLYEDDGEDDNDIGEEDWSEEKAQQMLQCVKARCSAHGCEDYLDTLLLDFFSEELSVSRKQCNNEEELETLRIAEDWINGSFAFDVGLGNKEAYIKDMERRDHWSKFKEEQEKIAFEIEKDIFHTLISDLLDSEG